jgi:hypothetical protein
MPELLPASKPVVANARVARKQCQGIWRQLGYSAIFNLDLLTKTKVAIAIGSPFTPAIASLR